VRLINKAIDGVRRTEAKQLERDGYEPILKHSRWGWEVPRQLPMRTAYGYRTPETAQIALYHGLSDLPEPEFTHEFW
jgi:hypothetical protein